MNIIVRPHSGRSCYCRPDTTWERENRDFYVPEGIREVRWAPVVFARISKAGKCIGAKFVGRYYDSFNFGALLYCVEDPEIPQEIAFTSPVDHSSILPSPLYNPIVMEGEENEYIVRRNGKEIFRTRTSSVRQHLEEAIATASRLTSLRIGDYVAVELDTLKFMASSADGETSLKATFCNNDIYDLKIIC